MPRGALLQVMVVDDQRTMRTLVRESLAQMGCHQVRECADGAEALAEMDLNPPHLIISDLNMPKMDGLQLLAAVRAQARWRNVGFIMLTSQGERDLVKKAVELGVNNYLVKPFSLASIRQKVEAVVGPLT
jgi:two-component system chemotaxis response regulator CheY